MPVPGAPTGLTVTSQNGSVLLNWAVPANIGGAAITDYRVQRRLATQPDASFVVVPDTVKATPGATIASNNGVSYVFRVAAINRFGVGAYSANSAAVTPYGIPATMAAPTCVSGNGQATINWIAPANNGSAITDYAVQRKLNGQADTTYVSLVDGVSTATTYTNTGLVNGAGYIYRVAAINARGASIWSAGSAFVVPSAAPNAPTGLTAVSGNGLVNLSWTAPANNGALITDYTIQRKLDGQADSSFVQVVDTVSPAVTASIASTNGTAYVFRVAAINIKGTGSYSANSAVVTPSTVPDQCSPPTCIRGISQVTLNWTAPANNGAAITNYVVQRKLSSQADTAYVIVPHAASSSTTLLDTSLVNGSSYVFRIAAVNVKGQGAFSNASQIVTPGANPPSAPTNVIATAGVFVPYIISNVRLDWTDPVDDGGSTITSYVVKAKSSGPTPYFDVASNYTKNNVIDISTESLLNTPIIFIVAAVNSYGVGAFSQPSNSVIIDRIQRPHLFDKNSWAGIVQEPYLTYLNEAADRWNLYIKYNPDVRAYLEANIAGWQGLRLNVYNLYTTPGTGTIASAGPTNSALNFTYLGKNRKGSYRFDLNIYDAYRNVFNRDNWIDIITHELGHALGLGTFWGNTNFEIDSTNHFLNQSIFPETQTAYNSITSTVKSKVAIESQGGAGSINSHWENNFRPSSSAGSLGVSYPGLTNELMKAAAAPGEAKNVLSILTIKNLVDLGWMEVNADLSEGAPNLATTGVLRFIDDENVFRCKVIPTEIDYIWVGDF
jgi:hypothetical protein